VLIEVALGFVLARVGQPALRFRSAVSKPVLFGAPFIAVAPGLLASHPQIDEFAHLDLEQAVTGRVAAGSKS
jgi:hypothetical protein